MVREESLYDRARYRIVLYGMSLLLRVPQPIWAGSFKLLSVNLDHLPPQTCACNCNNSSLFFNLIKAFSSLLVHPARLLIPSFCLLICSSRQSAGIGSNVITFAYPNQPPPDLSHCLAALLCALHLLSLLLSPHDKYSTLFIIYFSSTQARKSPHSLSIFFSYHLLQPYLSFVSTILLPRLYPANCPRNCELQQSQSRVNHLFDSTEDPYE